MIFTKRIAAATSSEGLYFPGAIAVLVCVMAAMQFAVSLLPLTAVANVLVTLSFVPARISFFFAPDAAASSFAGMIAAGFDGSDLLKILGGAGTDWWTLLTYAFVHGDWTHLTMNSAALMMFGAPVARRLGPKRFLAFFAVTAIVGALAYLVFHPFEIVRVVGASAAVSAAMAASARIVFAPGGLLGEARSLRSSAKETSPAPLSYMFTNHRCVAFLGLWFATTLLSGLAPQTAGVSGHVAWEAHAGGFLAGLLLLDLFDRPKGKARR